MMKKIVAIVMAVAALTAATYAGNITLVWDPYPTNDVTVTTIRVYALKGTNSVFAANNANANAVFSTSSTNNTLVATNLSSGWWWFVATAWSTDNIESENSNRAGSKMKPIAPATLRFVP